LRGKYIELAQRLILTRPRVLLLYESHVTGLSVKGYVLMAGRLLFMERFGNTIVIYVCIHPS